MYQSPIDISYIQDKINVDFEDGVFKAVRRIGIDVNKEELLKALAYDRGQYELGYHDALKEQPKWISVEDGMPENAEHLGAFCPRYNVMTEYGITQGWFNPDKGCWFVLAWFIYAKPDFYKAQFVDFAHGDIPYVTNKIKVTHWMPLPEPPEGVKQDETD